MPAILTEKFKSLLAKQLLSLIDDSKNEYLTSEGDSLPANSQNHLYLVLGKQLSWNPGSNTETAPVPAQTEEYVTEAYRTGIFARKLTLDNSTLVVSRINWTANTKYNTYAFKTNFYVLNSRDQVFKCLDNNSSANSTVEPEITLTNTTLDEPFLETTDGYKWKYMYTVHPSQKEKFLTEEWMPVYSNEFVRNKALSRSIDIVQITNAGSGYINSPTSDIITIDGDGTGAVLKANVSNGSVVGVVIQSRGQDYTYANLSFQADEGSNAAAIVKLAPDGGHGYDPITELKAKTFMVNINFDGNDPLHPVNNEFRQMFLVHNPRETSNSFVLATDSSYSLYTKLTVTTGEGNFNEDEIVYQGTNLSESTFRADVVYFDEVSNVLYINNVKGTLSTTNQIVGYSSGARRGVNEKTDPTMKLYSGDVLFISNKLPIQRDADQTDRVQFVLGF